MCDTATADFAQSLAEHLKETLWKDVEESAHMEELFASLHANLQRLIITQLGEPGTFTDYIAEWPLAMQQVLRLIRDTTEMLCIIRYHTIQFYSGLHVR